MTTQTDTIDWPQAPAVLNVLYRYAHAYDAGDAQMLESVFSEHAISGGVVSNSTSCWGPWSGGKTIANSLKALRDTQHDQRRHQITTPVFTHLSSEKAQLNAYLSLFSTPIGGQTVLATTGEYQVHLSRNHGTWKIDRLDGVLDGEF